MASGGGVRRAAAVLLAVGIVLAPGCRKNHPPDTPAVPVGPSSGAVGVEYTFSSSATDPDGDSVSVRFDWGDGDTSEWSTYAHSGDTVTMSHAWSTPGTFSVKAQARARSITISEWSTGFAFPVATSSWTRIFVGGGYAGGKTVRQTRDGGYVMAGFRDSYGVEWGFAWLIRTDWDGHVTWSTTLGEPFGSVGASVQQTLDDGFIVTGTCGTGGGDVFLVKTDSAGDTVWTRVFGGAAADAGASVQQTLDGGYVIAGTTWSYGAGQDDVWLLKTNAAGGETWNRTFGGTHEDWGNSVQQTQDGGYVITGYTRSFGAGSYDVWLVKTDSTGNEAWTRTFGGPREDGGLTVQQTQDGGYIIAGMTTSSGAGEHDVWLIKTDANGDVVWSDTYGGAGDDYGCSVQQTQDGGYIIAGATSTYGAGGLDVWLIKTDAVGDKVWDRTFGGTGRDWGNAVQQTVDGGYVIVGSTESYGSSGHCVLLIKTDAEGHVDEVPDEFRVQKSETRMHNGQEQVEMTRSK